MDWLMFIGLNLFRYGTVVRSKINYKKYESDRIFDVVLYNLGH